MQFQSAPWWCWLAFLTGQLISPPHLWWNKFMLSFSFKFHKDGFVQSGIICASFAMITWHHAQLKIWSSLMSVIVPHHSLFHHAKERSYGGVDRGNLITIQINQLIGWIYLKFPRGQEAGIQWPGLLAREEVLSEDSKRACSYTLWHLLGRASSHHWLEK